MMNHQQLTVYKANKVIEAGYKLTLNEQRVILACIAQVNSAAELLNTDRFELTAKDFALLFDISEDRAYSELQAIAKQLFHRYVIIKNPDPENPKLKYTQTHWITSIDYLPDDGKLVLFFAHKILPYLGQLRGEFTKYKLEHIGKMTSTYGIRLYELLAQWQSTGKREVEIAWLKKQFQLDEGYDRMFDFKKYVIDPAVKDINQHSNLTVSWTQRKTGRNVTHLIFSFAEKPPETKARLKQSKSATTKPAENPPAIALIYPATLTDLEKDKAAQLLALIEPQKAQELLDTLEAYIRSGQVKKSKLALLGGVIKRFKDGKFDPASAMQIAIERQTLKTNQYHSQLSELKANIKSLERLCKHADENNRAQLEVQLNRAREQLKAVKAQVTSVNG
jgi:plasmid replication initiation protein